ncbi:hypothetical protein WJ47_08890 [Burkholderia ubonensis]|uniref:Uncharacterized protein n=1 Tax=Burkholderia ubonensis TaxID=101571 RepID=A0AB73G942_9BURK|nr:hypothetical protein WJ44_06955 [Burkholderia ubonensis]KVL69537.1 hypothetical protein WJ47_08890 [Burkholderia ubonensis]KVM35661.1 hypothetical protein WJ53_31800 [Burkholderia ubonensis]KVM40389.1 hypothetical protein WJ54_29630 [Burkholderia ubonensis]KVQ90242.1 hypothetical protein WK10_31090 [Burkholderia ubonensis]
MCLKCTLCFKVESRHKVRPIMRIGKQIAAAANIKTCPVGLLSWVMFNEILIDGAHNVVDG